MQHNLDLDVCKNLLFERKRLNYSRKKIADFLDMSEKQVQRWESSVAIPSDKLRDLSNLDFNVHFVLTGKRSLVDYETMNAAINAAGDVLLGEKGITTERLGAAIWMAYEMVEKFSESIDEADGEARLRKYYDIATTAVKAQKDVFSRLASKD